MNVGDLRAALAKWPDDTEVAVINDLNNDLDTDVSADVAINHPGSRPRGRNSWHWEGDPTAGLPDGQTVIVLY